MSKDTKAFMEMLEQLNIATGITAEAFERHAEMHAKMTNPLENIDINVTPETEQQRAVRIIISSKYYNDKRV